MNFSEEESEMTPLVLAERCKASHNDTDKKFVNIIYLYSFLNNTYCIQVEENGKITNYQFKHINHRHELPEVMFVDVNKQNVIKNKGFHKTIFQFLKKVFKKQIDSVIIFFII